jgi:hypothetical protein
MTVRPSTAIDVRAARLGLAWALGACVVMTAAAGCNSATDASKSTASATAATDASPSLASTAPAGKPAGRKKVDTTSRREHQRQQRQQ